jgi:hypothetical protein
VLYPHTHNNCNICTFLIRYACFYPNGKYAGIQTPEAKKHFDAVLNVPTPLIAYFHYFIWNMTTFSPRQDIPVTACTTDQ